MHVRTMRKLLAPVPRNISQDVSSIYMKSLGLIRGVKSPEINLNLEPVCTQIKLNFIGKAETLLPPSITVPNQSNNTEQSSILPTVPEGKETAETDEINQVFQDQTRTEKLDRFLNSAPKCTCTPVRRNYTTELDDTKILLYTQLNKL